MHPLHRRALAAAALTATAVTAALPLGAAGAAAAGGSSAPPTVTTVSDGYLFPLTFAVSKGRIYVADAATATLSLNSPDRVIARGPKGGEIAGVEFDKAGRTFAYATTDYKTGLTTLRIKAPGRRAVVANLSAFEKRYNPDRRVRYGVDNPSKCVSDAFKKIEGAPPVTYTGIVESHPYAVASYGTGWIVADAAGNDLLRVNAKGQVSLLRVMPRQPFKITATAAASLGLPACAIGVTYNFESVPTDVEVGPRGELYVSTLPGGPEGPVPGFAGRGSVYLMSARTGAVSKIATGFSGTTNVAVTPSGKVYVSELGAGRVSVIEKRRPRVVVDLPNVVAVEYSGGKLYASTVAPTDDKGNPTGTGKIVRIG
jgi:hypothetical protein